jgi:hypothetical protein
MKTLDNRTSRKTLASQIDRLEGLIDGLGDGLNESIALALRDVLGQVVRDAVQTAVREVLNNPDLLATALAQHSPQQVPAPQPPAESRPLTEVLKHVGNWLGQKAVEKAGQVRRGFAWAWRSCLDNVKKAGAWSLAAFIGLGAFTCNLRSRLKTVGWFLWQFRRTGTMAVGAGLIAGLGSYMAGPLVAAILCGISGAVLSVAGLILVPLARLLMSGNECVG